MPSPRNPSRENRGFDWLGIARTVVFEVLVLLALSGVFIAYLNWSSRTAFQEFIKAGEPAVASPGQPPPSANAVQPVNGRAPCRPRV
jgi:hypothetical protein